MSCCRTKSCLSENAAQSEYRLAVEAMIRPGAICVGSAQGPGVSCSNYGELRKPINGPDGVIDPSLVQRSYISSGASPTKWNDMPDTQKDPIIWINNCGADINKGAGLQAIHTRNSLVNYASVNEQNVSPYALQIGNRWADGYVGMSSVGGNISTRQNSACETDQRFKTTEGYAFGSYGMM
jgi:hypothetical protein